MKRSYYSPMYEFSIVCGGMARPKPVYYLARSPSVGNCEKDLTPNMLLSRRYQFLFVHIAKITGGATPTTCRSGSSANSVTLHDTALESSSHDTARRLHLRRCFPGRSIRLYSTLRSSETPGICRSARTIALNVGDPTCLKTTNRSARFCAEN